MAGAGQEMTGRGDRAPGSLAKAKGGSTVALPYTTAPRPSWGLQLQALENKFAFQAQREGLANKGTYHQAWAPTVPTLGATW